MSKSFDDLESSGTEFIPSTTYSSSATSLENESGWSVYSEVSSTDGIIPIQSEIFVDANTLENSNILNSLGDIEINEFPHNLDAFATFTNQSLHSDNQRNLSSQNSNTLMCDEISMAECSIGNSSVHNLKNNEKIQTVINKTLGYMKENHSSNKPAKERPILCPICFNDDLPTHFTRHLLRHHGNHKDVLLLRSLKPRSKERLQLVTSLRKQGYFHLKIEKDILNPVRSSKNPDTEYFVCQFCLGHYTKNLLHKHVKICSNKPQNISKPGKNCLSESQTFMVSMAAKNQAFLSTSRIKDEVFGIMRPDNISFVAKSDPLIGLYGEMLLNKHKRQQMARVVSNKMREMARLLISLKSMDSEIQVLFDALKPEMFQKLVSATKSISGFSNETKNFKSPSVALHMGTNLKLICDVAFKIVVEKRNIPRIKWTNRDGKKKEIKELRKLVAEHWCSELSSLALKNLKENQWENPIVLPKTSDILSFQEYLNNCANEAFTKLSDQSNIASNFKILTECVLALTVMFNRKRIGDVQYLKVEKYISSVPSSNQEEFMESLTDVEKVLTSKFKRVVTGGKGSKPVPILFSKRIQRFIEYLIEIRNKYDIVPKSNPYLFANPGSETRWMNGTYVIRRLAQRSGISNPGLLTSTKFRKHIATTLQLMSMGDSEMEQVAKFMGHTKKTHAEFYRLPQDIYQTAKVAKILLLMEKGKGKEFQGRNLNEISLQRDVYYSSESEFDDEVEESGPLSKALMVSERRKRNTLLKCGAHDESILENSSNSNVTTGSINTLEKENIEDNKNVRNHNKMKIGNVIQGRRRWTDKDKKIVLRHFKNHIKNRITPKKRECEELISKNKTVFLEMDWVKIKTLVYNTFK